MTHKTLSYSCDFPRTYLVHIYQCSCVEFAYQLKTWIKFSKLLLWQSHWMTHFRRIILINVSNRITFCIKFRGTFLLKFPFLIRSNVIRCKRKILVLIIILCCTIYFWIMQPTNETSCEKEITLVIWFWKCKSSVCVLMLV